MKIAVATLVLLSLFGCKSPMGGDQPDDHAKTVSVDATFKPIVDSFYKDASARGKAPPTDDIIVRFAPPEEVQARAHVARAVAVCLTTADASTTPEVLVDQVWWGLIDKMVNPDQNRESLVFHELGHCLLGRKHDEEVIPGSPKTPKSVMYHEYINGQVYDEKHDYYLDELYGLASST